MVSACFLEREIGCADDKAGRRFRIPQQRGKRRSARSSDFVNKDESDRWIADGAA
jgi:hypothetical protein